MARCGVRDFDPPGSSEFAIATPAFERPLTTDVLAARRSSETKMPVHRFAVGQTVRLRSIIGVAVKGADVYRVTGTLPERDNSPQYRIRNDEERHERVMTEDSLEAVETASRGMAERAADIAAL